MYIPYKVPISLSPIAMHSLIPIFHKSKNSYIQLRSNLAWSYDCSISNLCLPCTTTTTICSNLPSQIMVDPASYSTCNGVPRNERPLLQAPPWLHQRDHHNQEPNQQHSPGIISWYISKNSASLVFNYMVSLYFIYIHVSFTWTCNKLTLLNHQVTIFLTGLVLSLRLLLLSLDWSKKSFPTKKVRILKLNREITWRNCSEMGFLLQKVKNGRGLGNWLITLFMESA